MRYAMIMAGGSGTRLWPMSRQEQPKQLIPFIRGKSLIELAVQRLEGLIPTEQQYICAGQVHRQAILEKLTDFSEDRYLGEPTGRDTLNAVGFAAAVLRKRDPDAVMAVLTADHIIQPADQFRQILEQGYLLAEQYPQSLVTFGITPDQPATGYGYLELGDAIANAPGHARRVDQFKEKPDQATAQRYFDAGPESYLWNSGMFVWRADTLLAAIEKFEPENYQHLLKIAEAFDTPQRQAVLDSIYPQLKKISIDFAVMEPASQDAEFEVAAIAMDVDWLDVGSWPAFARTCSTDEYENALAVDRHILMDSRRVLVASDQPEHLIATIGCEDLLIIHTQDATLVCKADQAQRIKELHQRVGEKFGPKML